ncbi:MAG: hypothetical protein LAT62_15250 [Natronospirillum sp.]|uniref:hypothetical protein n=1 Tax=Natronospirillum sp. TaxID=2812955 RepID=UPI0025D1EDD6|nr:hypothetical protein [Natronospirillum sp.]MCH8553294.1 hypothetical protein [Natronospirillum sp.]
MTLLDDPMTLNKRLWLTGALVFTLLLVACNAARELTNISVTIISEEEVQGSGGLPLGDLLGGFGSFDVTESENFQNSDATRNNLESSSLASFTLRVTDPDQQDLDFIDEMKVFIDANGEEKSLIAWYDDFESDQREATFNRVEDVDLTDYLRAEEAEIVTETEGSPPQFDTTLEVEMVLDINFLL